jgi:glutathione S-transferase
MKSVSAFAESFVPGWRDQVADIAVAVFAVCGEAERHQAIECAFSDSSPESAGWLSRVLAAPEAL